MNKIRIAILMSLLTASHWAAAELSYSNAGIGYIDGDFFRVDTDGFEVRGSYSLNPNFFLLASYDKLGVNRPPPLSDIDLDILAFGGGFHIGLAELAGLTGFAETMDLVATASILDVDLDGLGTDGIRLTGGVRAMANDFIEYSGNLVFEDIDDIDDDIGYEVSGRYVFAPGSSVGVTHRDVNGLETIRVDFRLDF